MDKVRSWDETKEILPSSLKRLKSYPELLKKLHHSVEVAKHLSMGADWLSMRSDGLIKASKKCKLCNGHFNVKKFETHKCAAKKQRREDSARPREPFPSPPSQNSPIPIDTVDVPDDGHEGPMQVDDSPLQPAQSDQQNNQNYDNAIVFLPDSPVAAPSLEPCSPLLAMDNIGRTILHLACSSPEVSIGQFCRQVSNAWACIGMVLLAWNASSTPSLGPILLTVSSQSPFLSLV